MSLRQSATRIAPQSPKPVQKAQVAVAPPRLRRFTGCDYFPCQLQSRSEAEGRNMLATPCFATIVVTAQDITITSANEIFWQESFKSSSVTATVAESATLSIVCKPTNGTAIKNFKAEFPAIMSMLECLNFIKESQQPELDWRSLENAPQNSPVKSDVFRNVSVKFANITPSIARNLDAHVRSDAVLLRDPQANSTLVAALLFDSTVMHHRIASSPLSVILYDSLFSASIAFPNKKDMDSFIVAFVRAKASTAPVSSPTVGGLSAPSAGDAAAGVDGGIMAHVLMAGGTISSFMMQRAAKIGDLFANALGDAFQTDRQYFELFAVNGETDHSLLLLQSIEEYCVRHPLPKAPAFDSATFRTCIVELRQIWYMPLNCKAMPLPLLQSCVYHAHLEFIYVHFSSFPEAALANLLALLVIMHGQEQRSEFFVSVCSLYRPPNMTDKLLQLLRESVPASVRRFRELGLNNKMHGPKFHSAAAEKFMQLCFRSLSYGVHSFDTCLLLEQDIGPEKRIEAAVHLSRMGIIVLDRGSLEVLDRLAVNMIRRTGVMDDAWLIDTGDWRQPSIVVLQCTQPRRLNDILNQYLSFLQAQAGDDSSSSASQVFSETFSGWLEEKGIIGYNRKFVVVFTDRIVFYEDETRTSVKDSITSMDVTGVALLPQPPASAMQIASGMEKVPFELVLPDKKRILYAFSQAMGDLWVEALESLIEVGSQLKYANRASQLQ